MLFCLWLLSLFCFVCFALLLCCCCFVVVVLVRFVAAVVTLLSVVLLFAFVNGVIGVSKTYSFKTLAKEIKA